MADLSIPLHGKPTVDIGAVLRSVLGANLLIWTISGVFFGLVPFLSGEKPDFGDDDLLMIGVATLIAVVVAAAWQMRAQYRRGLGHPMADFRLANGTVSIVKRGEENPVFRSSLDELQARAVLAQEKDGGKEYYVGPGIEIFDDGGSWVIAALDGVHRWNRDPPAVSHVRYICPRDRVSDLARACAIDAELVNY